RLAPALASALRRHRADVRALEDAALRDRTIETWRGLLATAELADDPWPARAVEAALALHGDGAGAEPDRGTALLEALKEAFDAAAADRLPTAAILERLVEREGEPWPAWWGQEVEAARDRGRPPRRAASDLARMLKGFRVQPRVIKLPDGSTARGYLRADLEPAWAAYLPEGERNQRNQRNRPASGVTSVTSVTSEDGEERDP
ncbi:MAG TPA: DUF3631 domain-containing protein, partial [Actinomycetota bacterium]|nr:DUF3631 domain-containing protein [Actinomycetota bacterium]